MGEDATAQMQCQSNHLPIVSLPGITGKSSLRCFFSVHVLIWKYSNTFFERGKESRQTAISVPSLWAISGTFLSTSSIIITGQQISIFNLKFGCSKTLHLRGPKTAPMIILASRISFPWGSILTIRGRGNGKRHQCATVRPLCEESGPWGCPERSAVFLRLRSRSSRLNSRKAFTAHSPSRSSPNLLHSASIRFVIREKSDSAGAGGDGDMAMVGQESSLAMSLAVGPVKLSSRGNIDHRSGWLRGDT